jgi:hypothetical protein
MPSIDAKEFLAEGKTSGIDFFIANRKKIFKHIIDWQVKEQDLVEEKREAQKELKRIRSIPTVGLNQREKKELEKQKHRLMEIIRKEGPEIPIETEQAAFAMEHKERLLQILKAQEELREKLRGPIESVAGFVLSPARWVSDALANRWEEFESVSQEIRNLPKVLVNWI